MISIAWGLHFVFQRLYRMHHDSALKSGWCLQQFALFYTEWVFVLGSWHEALCAGGHFIYLGFIWLLRGSWMTSLQAQWRCWLFLCQISPQLIGWYIFYYCNFLSLMHVEGSLNSHSTYGAFHCFCHHHIDLDRNWGHTSRTFVDLSLAPLEQPRNGDCTWGSDSNFFKDNFGRGLWS